MSHSMHQIICISIFVFSVAGSNIHAYCAKCARIEAERAKEQALHPQPDQYYDESLINKSNSNSDQKASPKSESTEAAKNSQQ